MIPSLPDLEGFAQETTEWMVKLQAEIGQPAKRDINSQVKAPKIIGSPAPWNSEAAGTMTTIEESARRHVRYLRHLLGHTTPVASSAEGARTAVLALPALIDATRTPHADAAGQAARELKSWPRRIRSALDMALSDEIRTMRLDSRCPYCNEKLSAKADGSGDILCLTDYCHHHDGVPCKDPLTCDLDGWSRYRWARSDWSRLLDDLAKNTA